MPRGRRTSYTRDNRGRFASSPGGGAPKRSTPATRRAATRAGNRLNRDNSGRISGIGRDGATVRGGRLKTAKGNRRATQLASMKAAGFRGGTIAKGGRGVRGTVAKPRGMKPGVLAARRGVKAGKPFKKAGTSLDAVKARRQRALAPKNSTYLSNRMETRSAVVRSAANAIYNRQRTVGKALGLAPSVVRQPIGIMPGLSGSNRNRAMASLENARTRVVKGRKGRR